MRFLLFLVIVLFLLPITAKEEKNINKRNILKVSATIVTGSVLDKNWEEKLFANEYAEPDEEVSDELVEKQDGDVQTKPEQVKVPRQIKKVIKTLTQVPGEILPPDDIAELFNEEAAVENDPVVDEEINEKPDESLENKDPVVADEENTEEKIEEKEPVRSEREYLTDETRKSQREIIIKMKDRRRKRKAQ